jgi:hypothetical protein
MARCEVGARRDHRGRLERLDHPVAAEPADAADGTAGLDQAQRAEHRVRADRVKDVVRGEALDRVVAGVDQHVIGTAR